MKNFFFLLLTLGMFTFASCGDDDTQEETGPDYHIHFITPAEDGSTTTMQGQTLSLEIEVEEHDGETIHHMSVKVSQKDDSSVVIFDGPVDVDGEPSYHVHEESGKYTFKHDLELDPANVDGHTDWNVDVKVWGHEAGAAEVTANTTFHVHPM